MMGLPMAYVTRLNVQAGLAWDDGAYLTLGKSLASGHGIRVISAPESPIEAGHPPNLSAHFSDDLVHFA